MQQRPFLVFVGGFLGAGKTTLILSAARMLIERGKRVAVIMNDQDSELVDTKHAQARDIAAREVAGGCFCCRFSDLMNAAEALESYEPDVIFAEPVGSCVDLSATILQPLKSYHRDTYRLAPLTVLIDPAAASRQMDADSEFLFRNQLAEADLACTTKSDLYADVAQLPFPIDFALSGKTGAGVSEWLEEVLAGNRVAGARLLDVDYERYADAEAALGWLNLHAEVVLTEPSSPSLVCGPLLDGIEEQLRAESIEIAHLKLFDQCASGWLKVSITGNSAPQPEGDLLSEPAITHELALNLRALGDPEELRRIVEHSLDEVAGKVAVRHLRAFRPAAPTPEHRFISVL